MATINSYNFNNHHEGDTWNGAIFTIKENGAAVDLTGIAAKCQFRKNSKRGRIEKVLTVGDGITITDAAGGVLTLDKIDALSFQAGFYYYDIQVTFPSGKVRTYVEGYLPVNQDTTQ